MASDATNVRHNATKELAAPSGRRTDPKLIARPRPNNAFRRVPMAASPSASFTAVPVVPAADRVGRTAKLQRQAFRLTRVRARARTRARVTSGRKSLYLDYGNRPQSE
jgi:hypothetical protein